MYHVISTGITALLLYLISSLLYRNSLYSRRFHRKIWNFILAITFFLTSVAGLFLALQVNYKWNIPIIKTILKWHVECGIGFSFTAILHFLWHFPYYLRSDNKEAESIPEEYLFGAIKNMRLNLFMIGLVSTSVQVLLMREVMNITGGYELITGIFLGSWLICSAAGSVMAKRSSANNIRRLNTLFAVSPFFSITLTIFLTRMLLTPGESPSVILSLIITLLVLLPFCFVSGYVFIRLCIISLNVERSDAGKLFSVETAGGVLAGFIVTAIGSGILNTYQTLLIILTIFFFYITVTFYNEKRRSIAIPLLITIIVCGLIICLNPDILFRQLLLPGIKVTKTGESHYGNITVGEYHGERSIYYNHHLLKWQNNETEREENVHYAMIQRESAKRILVVSGDLNPVLDELMKYPVEKVTYIERDPALLKYYNITAGQHPFELKTENNDAARFIRETQDTFDVILVLLPPPSTMLLNRYYTSEFFSGARKKLSHNGVFMCSPGIGENYFNKESTVLYSSIFVSLGTSFKNILPVVGNKLYYLASEGPLSTDICNRITEKNIRNIYVSSDYLSDDLIKMKSEEFTKTLNMDERENSLSRPVASFHFQNYNISKNAGGKIPAFILMALVFVSPAIFIKRRNYLMYTTAGALAGFEIVLLLLLQATAGNMYHFTGLIISAVMTGLALGSGINYLWLNKITPVMSAVSIGIIFILSGFSTDLFLTIGNKSYILIIVLFMALLPSFLTGHLYRELVNRGSSHNTPSEVYGSDLAGSALGFVIISTISVPVLGLKATIILLSVLIFAGILPGATANKY
jgi:spermidine synthase